MQQIKQKKSPIKTRILQYLEFKGITKYAFYKDSGITRGVLDQESGITEDNIARFVAYAQDISPEWLISGIGNMLKGDHGKNFQYENSKKPIQVNCIDDCIGNCIETKTPKNLYKPELQKTFSNDDIKSTDLKAPERDPRFASYLDKMGDEMPVILEGEGLLTSAPQGKGSAVRLLESQQIPFYEFEATAGLANIFSTTGTPVSHLTIPNISHCDGAIRVRGDSMYPLLKSGDVVVFKLNNSTKYILWGDIYIISFSLDGDDYTVIKTICKSSRPDYISLESYNAEGHPPMEIPMSAIRQLAHVKAWIHYNAMG